MSVDEARRHLIELERQKQDTAELLDEARKAFEAKVQEIVDAEAKLQQIRKDSEEALRRLEVEEQREAQAERKAEIDDEVLELEAKFLRVAEDKIWFTGTGHEDAILPHQWQGMMFGAVAERWLLGDGVGLGKTRTTIGWLDLVKAKKVIIICEANICGQFSGEVTELAPHRKIYNLAKKTPEKRHLMLDEILQQGEAVVVVNFEIWRRDPDVLAKLIRWEADTVVVDEAHNLKSTSTSNFQNVKTLVAIDNVCPECRGHIKGLYDPSHLPRKVPRPCEHCGWKVGDRTSKRYSNQLDEHLSTKSVKNLCLTTGTPLLNSPLDLYALLHLINPVLFKNAKRFKNLYLTNNYHSGKWDFARGALDDLKPMIEGMYLARNAEDAGIIIPKQTHVPVSVPLDKLEYPKQYKAIRQISDTAQLILESGEAMTIMHIIALITRKRQANVWPGGIVIKNTDKDSPDYGKVLFDAGTEIDESVKMDSIMERVLHHHESGERQIVFSQFKTALAELEQRLEAKGIRAVRFDGDTPEELRKQVKSNFNRSFGEEPKWDVVLANYKTGGTGLNFTAATVTHVMDEEWNPGKRDQAYGRTARIGQTEESTVYVYRIPGTVDTWMSNTIHRKEQMVGGFRDTMIGAAEEDLATSFLEGLKSGEIL